ncbi:hypothetical protein [Bacillus sp. SRB3LM]|uniref:hypothetical protein n=1 Tax=Bacillus sp. SRB3LM TaxID=2608689 RepID=UPI0018C419FB|nr:hypothetical protein [Bacillus sp. SRB3LM]MBG0969462.1 hypothetical protein [Bacillus sp. SRB3LM]
MAYVNEIDWCKCYGLTEGDNIHVFSGGKFIGKGSFIRIENQMLVWIDKHVNMNFTDLRVSSIRKISSFCKDN